MNRSGMQHSSISWTAAPNAVFSAVREFAPSKAEKLDNNFLKGVKWSPDGTCLLTNSEDHKIRLFEMYEIRCRFRIEMSK